MLQKKARGFGKGKWNGPGGKVKPGETPAEAAIREIKEETGVAVKRLKPAGVIEFIFNETPESNNLVYVFVAEKWEGLPEDRGEGKLSWYDPAAIPLDKMWDDDRYWLPGVLNGGTVSARFYFDAEGIVVKQEKLATVEKNI